MGSVAIARDGQLIYQHHLGFAAHAANSGAPLAADSTTCYAIGSMTKLFTAVMILQLTETRQLSLKTKLSQFYPGIPGADGMTIEMLLGHRSGLPEYTFEPIANINQDSLLAFFHFDQHKVISSLEWLQKPLAKSVIMGLIRKGKSHFSPGSKIEYNNSGYWLLGGIIEKVTGLSYAENLKRRITEKIGLHNTYVAVAADPAASFEQAPSEARAYSYCAGWQPEAELFLPNARGAGDIRSTPRDLIKFMQALFDLQLIHKKSLAVMADFYDQDSTERHQMGFGLESAFFKSPQGDRVGVGHSGDTYGSHGAVIYFPDNHLSICCLLNGHNPEFDRNDMLKILFEAAVGDSLPNPLMDNYAMSEAQLWPLVGRYYCNQLHLGLTVARDCHTLVISPVGQQPFITYCTQPFRVTNPSLHVVCRFDPEGQKMELYQNGKTYVFLHKAKDTEK